MSTDYVGPFMNVDATTAQALRGQTIPSNIITTLESNIKKAQNNELNQIFNTSEQASTTALNYSSLFSKNQSISLIAKDMTEQNKKVNNGARDTYARQAEINEWQAQNKLDTLFFLQILFLYFAVLVILIFLRQSSLVPSSMLYIIGGIGLLIVIGVLWNRAGYTSRSRDKRYWNRRYIGLSDSGDLQAKLQCSLS
jgi:hypothetical protein